MVYSLNEIEAICKKAAFGAGLPFGVAEEAGKAARWLAAHDLPGPELLAKLLSIYQQKPYSAYLPIAQSETSFAASETTCPLMAGAVLTDRIKQAVEKGIDFHSLAYPLLLVPYVSICARSADTSFEICFDEFTVEVTNVGGLNMTGQSGKLMTSLSKSVTVIAKGKKPNLRPVRNFCRKVDEEGWRILTLLAYQKFAPATESSRELGAG